jgi:hypothetical protein
VKWNNPHAVSARYRNGEPSGLTKNRWFSDMRSCGRDAATDACALNATRTITAEKTVLLFKLVIGIMRPFYPERRIGYG